MTKGLLRGLLSFIAFDTARTSIGSPTAILAQSAVNTEQARAGKELERRVYESLCHGTPLMKSVIEEQWRNYYSGECNSQSRQCHSDLVWPSGKPRGWLLPDP